MNHEGGFGVRIAAAVVTGGVILALLPGVAAAHDPVIITNDQTTAAAGPSLPDGTVSFALYGVLDAPGATRGMRAHFDAGDRLSLTLLIPAQQPEQSLTTARLPTLTLTAPDGSRRRLVPNQALRFDESFSQTSYVQLLEVDEPAQAGTYDIVVTGAVPARFTVSIGSREQFGTPVDNVSDRGAGVAGVQQWYATPPPAAPELPATTSPVTASIESSDTAFPTTAVPATAATTAAETTAAVAPTTVAHGTDSTTGSWVIGGVIAVMVLVALGLYWRTSPCRRRRSRR